MQEEVNENEVGSSLEAGTRDRPLRTPIKRGRSYLVVAVFISQGFKKLCGKYRYLTLIDYACCKNALYNLGKFL